MSIDAVRQMLSTLLPDPDMPFMARRRLTEQFAQAFQVPEGVEIEADVLDGMAAEWVVPRHARKAPVVMHLHGGGYVLGDPTASRPFTTAFALKSGFRVVSIDYRLAPENPFPAAVDDAVSAYRALRMDGITPVAIGGESAGGGLTLATLIALRDLGVPLPGSAFAISPWVDMTCSAQSFDMRADVDPMLTRRALKEMAEAYLAGADEKDPLASPLYGDLRDLPPLLIHVGSDEVLRDDAHAFHAAALAAGVHSTLEEWPGMIHVWHMFHPMLAEGDRAIGDIASFVNGRARWAV